MFSKENLMKTVLLNYPEKWDSLYWLKAAHRYEQKRLRQKLYNKVSNFMYDAFILIALCIGISSAFIMGMLFIS